MQFPQLPPNADEGTRAAMASLALLAFALPLLRKGSTIHDEGWAAVTEQIAAQYGSGTDSTSRWLRETLAKL